jgi:hypothetical protein
MAFKVQHPNRKINHAVLIGFTLAAAKTPCGSRSCGAIGGENVELQPVKNEDLNSRSGATRWSRGDGVRGAAPVRGARPARAGEPPEARYRRAA